MSDQDQEFQQRWGFRRNESDLDSSSEDHSRPSSSSEPKLKKHKLIFSEENNQETINIESDHETEAHPNSEEPNKEPSESCKEPNPKREARQRTVRSRKPRKRASHSEPSDTPSNDLSGHTQSLIEGIKVAREDLLKWMSKEMGKPIQDDNVISLKPDVKRRGQKQNLRRSKSARSNPNKGRKKSGATTQKQDEGSSEKSVKGKTVSHPINADIAEPPKESQNVPTSTTTVATTEKQKRKRSRPSANKQKTAAAPPDDQPNSKTAVVALPAPAPASSPTPTPTPPPNYLTLPTLLPRPQSGNAERNPLGDGNERDFGKRNALNTGINLSSQLSCFPRSQQKDGVFAQNGLRHVNDYEQNTGLTIGNVRPNGNGNGSANGFPFSLQNGNGSASASASGSGFPFSLYPHPQGLHGGIGIQHPSQFGMQFLSQDNRMSGHNRMNGGLPRLPNGNHGFMDSYGSLNQQLRFKAQGGALGLQCPDVRGTNLQPRQ